MLWVRKKNKTLTSNILVKVSIFLKFKKKPVSKGRPTVPLRTEGLSLGQGLTGLWAETVGLPRPPSPAGSFGTGPHSSRASFLRSSLLPCLAVLLSCRPKESWGILAFLSSPFSFFIFSEALKKNHCSLGCLSPAYCRRALRIAGRWNCLPEGEQAHLLDCLHWRAGLEGQGCIFPGTRGFHFCINLQMKDFYQYKHHRRVKEMEIILNSKKKWGWRTNAKKILSNQYCINSSFLFWTQRNDSSYKLLTISPWGFCPQ